MSAKKHILFDDFFEENFLLVAIHSHAEAYKIAFMLNKHVRISFYRTDDVDEQRDEIVAYYPLFTYYDIVQNCDYFLVGNKVKTEAINPPATTQSLFEEAVQSLDCTLLPEYKKVDYFIKIEDPPERFSIQEFIEKIKKIPLINTAYQIDQSHIKSKENLIFS